MLTTPAAAPPKNPTMEDRWARNKMMLQSFSTDMPWDPFQVPRWHTGTTRVSKRFGVCVGLGGIS